MLETFCVSFKTTNTELHSWGGEDAKENTAPPEQSTSGVSNLAWEPHYIWYGIEGLKNIYFRAGTE